MTDRKQNELRSPTLHTFTRHAFTLIELLVVISIIGILIAVLLPAFGTVRNQAKFASATAQYKAIEQGIELFRGEDALGASFPPSRSDRDGEGVDHHTTADPFANNDARKVITTGANLLVYALLGADLLGTPGFKDVDRDGKWWDDMHGQAPGSSGRGGVYYIDPATGDLGHSRYGGAGYVDDKMRARVTTLEDLEDSGAILNLNKPSSPGANTYKQPLFVDPWDKPVLYYKANPAARLMLFTDSNPDKPGIYHHDDNGLITGNGSDFEGVDFGQGRLAGGGAYHALTNPGMPPTAVDPTFPANAAFDNTFGKFIHDASVKRVHTPVRKDEYLLISAGADGRYGTSDDVTNWERKSN